MLVGEKMKVRRRWRLMRGERRGQVGEEMKARRQLGQRRSCRGGAGWGEDEGEEAAALGEGREEGRSRRR